jgi:hypothetical protein
MWAGLADQTPAQFGEHVVADVVTMPVVEALEIVEVDEEHRDGL